MGEQGFEYTIGTIIAGTKGIKDEREVLIPMRTARLVKLIEESDEQYEGSPNRAK